MDADSIDKLQSKNGGSVIGRFEWWIEDESSDFPNTLTIQQIAKSAQQVSPLFYPELTFDGGWGMPVEAVTEQMIIAAFLYRKALSTLIQSDLEENDYEEIPFIVIAEQFEAKSFAEILAALKAPYPYSKDSLNAALNANNTER